MRRLAFITALLGLFILLTLMHAQFPVSIKTLKEFNKTKDNDKVIISGKIIEEKSLGKSKLLLLDNNIELFCSCKNNFYINKHISALGIVDDFTGEKRIVILRIKNAY